MNAKKFFGNSNRTIGLIVILIGIVVLIESRRIYSYAISFLTGDHIIPAVAGCVLIILGINLAFLSPPSTVVPSWPKGNILKRVLGTALIMVLYVGLMDYLGYLLTTALTLYALFRVFGRLSRLKSTAIALITIGTIYGVFVAWLNMPFPQGFFRYL